MLVDRYRYPVYGICLWYTRGDFDAAEDATQEAFIASWLKLRDLSDPDYFGPWLKRIALNECRMWRREQRRRVSLSEEEAEALVDPSASPEDQVIAQETHQEVLTAIGQLSKPQQQVVTLFYLEELSLKQIADFLEIPLQTVNQRLYRARLRLKEEMLSMIEDIFSGHKLPADFTEKVVQEALSKGNQLLGEYKWSSARQEFRKVVETIPDHTEANRGLALALDGEVRMLMKKTSPFEDRKLLQEAIAALEQAYHVGARDRRVVQSLDDLYTRYGRYRESAQFYERVAADREDWRESVYFLKRAIARFNRSGDMESCVRCHRRVIELVPADLSPRPRLDIWRPAGVAFAYPHVGAAEEALLQLKMLGEEVGDEWGIYERSQFHGARSGIFREMRDWEGVVREGRTYVEWARSLPENDPCLFREDLRLEEGVEEASSGSMTGERVRWGTLCGTLTSIVIAQTKGGFDSDSTFADLEWALERHEAHFLNFQRRAEEKSDNPAIKEEAEREKRGLVRSYISAGRGAFEGYRYADAVRYYRREEELAGRLYVDDPLRLAASLVALGRTHEARDRLRNITGRHIPSGRYRGHFETFREFDAVREDPAFVAIIEGWKRAEAVGQK